MLDDLKMIHQRDAQDALGKAERQWRQLGFAYELPGSFKPDHVYNIVYAAMGGSALAGMAAKAWLSPGEPFEVVRGYDLPTYIDKDTLCIVGSYSGNTEESVEALRQALTKGAQAIVIASGGQLEKMAAEHGLPYLQVPQEEHMRNPVWYMVNALATVFDACGLTQGKVAELAAQQEWWRERLAMWRPDMPTSRNQAKQLALELMGKSVVIYAGPKLAPVANKWKIAVNENAKQLAWWNEYPEFNHNELTGWSKQPVDKPYAVIELPSRLENPRIGKRFEISKRLLSGLWPAPQVVEPQGETLLQQLLYGFGLADFVALYLALLNGVNPTPLELVDKLKKELV